MKQKLAKKDPDGIVRETHVYSGPQGDGFIVYEYRMNGTEMEVKAEHTGPEARELPVNWTAIPDVQTTEKFEARKKKETIDEVIEVIDVEGNRKAVVRKEVDVPVYEERIKLLKHPHKEKFFKENK